MTRATEVVQWMIALYLLGEVLGWMVVRAVQERARVRRDARS